MNKKPQSPGKKSPNSSNENNPDKFHWKRAGKTSLVWISIIVCAIYISGLLTDAGKKEIEIEYTKYKEHLKNRDIQKAVVIGNVFHGEFKLVKTVDTDLGPLENVTHFKLTLPFVDRTVIDEWDDAELNYTFQEKTIDWTGYLLNMLPWLLLIGFWINQQTI